MKCPFCGRSLAWHMGVFLWVTSHLLLCREVPQPSSEGARGKGHILLVPPGTRRWCVEEASSVRDTPALVTTCLQGFSAHQDEPQIKTCLSVPSCVWETPASPDGAESLCYTPPGAHREFAEDQYLLPTCEWRVRPWAGAAGGRLRMACLPGCLRRP